MNLNITLHNSHVSFHYHTHKLIHTEFIVPRLCILCYQNIKVYNNLESQQS